MGKRKLTDARRAYLRWRLAERRRSLKLKCIEYKGGKCEKCGYNKCPASMVFHHLDPSIKDYKISDRQNKPFNKIKKELDKCMLVCANCHNEIHYDINMQNLKETTKKIRELVPEKSTIAGSVFKNCFNCDKKIKVFKSHEHKRNFCSRKCSDEVVYNTGWPPDEELLKLFETKTAKQLAAELGKTEGGLTSRLKRIRKKIKANLHKKDMYNN